MKIVHTSVYLPTRTYGNSEKEALIVLKCKVRAVTHYRMLANVMQSTCLFNYVALR